LRWLSGKGGKMIREIDFDINVVNGYGKTEKITPVGKIFFISFEGPSSGYNIELSTKDKVIYRYENSPVKIVENQLHLPLLGDLKVEIEGTDGNYTLKIALEEKKFKSIAEYLDIVI
jgi:hypothetical protein